MCIRDRLGIRLKEAYPRLQIVGMYSPPFRPMTVEEDAEIIEQINETKPDFIWVGLGAPKQERWMAEHKGKVNGIMLGVGAGFDFHAGTVLRAPVSYTHLDSKAAAGLLSAVFVQHGDNVFCCI